LVHKGHQLAGRRTFFISIAPSLPELISSVNPKVKVGSGLRPYQFGWILAIIATTIIATTIIYIGLSK
jgi:hypothetical protein